MLLHHGTTRVRAEAILASGPDPNYREPGEVTTAEGFSTARPESPARHGTPEAFARLKAALFPTEGGPVILEIEVPDGLVRLADDFGDEVRFSLGYGLEELLQVWPSLPKRLIELP
jgi:hypothetical protein